MSNRQPNTVEVRAWARERFDGVGRTGFLPRAVVAEWNRTHPSRKYDPDKGYHGTYGGYTNKRCKCVRCDRARKSAREKVAA